MVCSYQNKVKTLVRTLKLPFRHERLNDYCFCAELQHASTHSTNTDIQTHKHTHTTGHSQNIHKHRQLHAT